MKYTGRGEKRLSFSELSGVTTALDYVLMALAESKGMEAVYKQFDLPVELKGSFYENSANVQIQCIGGEEFSMLKTTGDLQESYQQVVFEKEVEEYRTEAGLESLLESLNYQYAHRNLAQLYTKTTVSELKKAAFPVEEGAKPMFEEEKEKVTLPKFIKGEEAVLGTTRGTAFHKVMEVFPFESLSGKEDFTEEMVANIIKKQAECGKLPEEFVPLVNVKKVWNFLNSSLAKRMICAAKEGKLYKEQPFVYGIGADRLNKEFPATETVLIQGIIDAYFEEEDGVVLLDYKTDVIDTQEALVKRYQTQLDYYAEVLERLLSKPVKDIAIYSFHFEKEIKLQKSK